MFLIIEEKNKSKTQFNWERNRKVISKRSICFKFHEKKNEKFTRCIYIFFEFQTPCTILPTLLLLLSLFPIELVAKSVFWEDPFQAVYTRNSAVSFAGTSICMLTGKA